MKQHKNLNDSFPLVGLAVYVCMRKLCTRLISGYAKTLTKHGFICERQRPEECDAEGMPNRSVKRSDDGICFLTCLLFFLLTIPSLSCGTGSRTSFTLLDLCMARVRSCKSKFEWDWVFYVFMYMFSCV